MHLPTLLFLATTVTGLSVAAKKPYQATEVSEGFLDHHHPYNQYHQTSSGNPYAPQTYSYGCYTEALNGKRALTGPSYTNYTSMTLDECEYYCTGYKLWGVEYGGDLVAVLALDPEKRKPG